MPFGGGNVKSQAMEKMDTYDVPERDATLAELEDSSVAGFEAKTSDAGKTEARSRTAPISEPGETPARDAPKRPSKRRIALAAALVAALGIGGYYGHYWLTEGRYLVSTDDAYVKADMSVISAKVAGIVMRVPIKDNIPVRAGDVLAQIDDRDYKIAVEAARNKLATEDATIERLKQQLGAQRAVIEQAKAQLASAKAGQTRASADFERAQELAQKEFSSRQRLDQARADRDQGQASVKAAEAAQASAEANLSVFAAQVKEAEGVRAELQTSLDKALLDLSFTTVKAAFNGVVGNKVVQVGQYVQPGTRLLSLVPLDTAYIEANYKETQLDGIRPGMPAEVAVDAASGRVYRGVVESIAPASGSQYSLLPPENATGNFTKIVQRVPVRIRVEGDAIRDGVLRPGLSVVTSVNTKKGAEQGNAAVAQAEK
jgi:membrane fusion protein, multidrug efflux system